jgi:hypothetical protein
MVFVSAQLLDTLSQYHQDKRVAVQNELLQKQRAAEKADKAAKLRQDLSGRLIVSKSLLMVRTAPA